MVTETLNAAAIEKKFAVEIVYNGVTKSLSVQPEEQATAILARAIALFGITQNPHLLSLFREDGTVVPENESAERAGLKAGEVLLLRPNAVKGGGKLLVTGDVLPETFRTLSACGEGRRECVAYWTGPANDAVVDGVEHPIHKRSAYGYEVDDGWLTQFWKKLAQLGRSIKAQVHTHPGAAFHSAVDDQWPIISQPGFLSIVIPNFASRAASLENAWVGRLRPDGVWEQLPSADHALQLV